MVDYSLLGNPMDKLRLPLIVISSLILGGCSCSTSAPYVLSSSSAPEESQPTGLSTPPAASSDIPDASTDVPEESSEAPSSSEEIISSSQESSTPAVTVSSLTPEQYSLLPGYYVDKVQSLSTFKAVTVGKTVATWWFINYDQSIDVTLIKSEYSYLKNESHSTLVNTVHEAYFHQEETLSRDGENGDFVKHSLEEYLATYGVNPLGRCIEGYRIDDGAITNVEKLESEGDAKFKLTFDTEKATPDVKVQMKKFGGLSEDPAFSSVEITLTLLDDFTPVSIDLEAKYKAKTSIIETDCTQTYTVTFSEIGESVEVPNLEEVRTQYEF